ncbi:MAG: hypothetical protein QXN26_01565 [Thermoplasmataceae archaeon]
MYREFRNPENGRNIRVYSGVKGLISHGDELKSLLNTMNPEVILVTIAPSEVTGLKEFLRDPFEMNLSDYEIIYGIRLRKYGEVMTPPPIYIEVISYSEKSGSQVTGIDMDDETYNSAYTQNIKSLDLLRDSLRKKRVLNTDYHDTNEYEFAEAWAEKQKSIRGRRKLEEIRIRYIAGKVREFVSENYVENHIIVCDHEFYRGIRDALASMGYVQEDHSDQAT